MNFDVTKAIEGMEPIPERPAVVPMSQVAPKSTERKLSPVEELQRKNDAYDGVRVDHQANEAKRLKNAADRDIEDVMKELPGNIADMQQVADRRTRVKLKLGLGEGGFVDQEIETYNFKTGQVGPDKFWATSQEIQQIYVAREPTMSDEEMEDFYRSYYVEFDMKTGEVKPRKYPGKPGFKTSIIFPTQSVSSVKPIDSSEMDQSTNYKKQEPVNRMDTVEESVEPNKTEPQDEATKVKFKVEEMKIGVRKSLSKEKLVHLSEMILDRNAVPMTAIASRYKCDISGVTYEEYDQVRSMVETSTLAMEIKMWSMVYRHIRNSTIGNFKSFEDFCEHTAWVDRQRFWFALMCAMTKDEDVQSITCHNAVFKRIAGFENLDLTGYEEDFKEIRQISQLPTDRSELKNGLQVYAIIDLGGIKYKYIPEAEKLDSDTVKWIAVEEEGECNTTYQINYINRDLIDTTDTPKWVAAELDKINEISAMNDAIAYHEEGALRQNRIVKLNDIVSVEVGFKSVADVLRKDYKFVVSEELSKTIRDVVRQQLLDEMEEGTTPDEDELNKEIDEFLNSERVTPYVVGIVLCQIINKVILRDENGEDSESDDPIDIVSIIKNCPPSDVAVLVNEYDTNHLLYRYATSYEPKFSYKNCKCPSCGYTVNVPIAEIRDLVFTLSRSSRNTTFDIESL